MQVGTKEKKLNKKNITYLFGAGASCEALPLVKDFSDRLNAHKNNISKMGPEYCEQYKSSSADQSLLSTYLESVDWLINHIKENASIDTFAKKLFLKDDQLNLNKLKSILCLFFMIEQIQNKPDKRYDNFFASILNNDGGSIYFPKNINIISWNYDSQFEISAMPYFDSNNIEAAKAKLQAIDYVLPEASTKAGFQIIKMNGTAALLNANKIIHHYGPEITMSDLHELLLLHYKNETSLIRFAWENQMTASLTRDAGFKSVGNTQILVVVGYSFPFFNREIDKTLILNMPSLEKVYFQCPEKDFSSVMNAFEASAPSFKSTKVHVSGLNQFYLPAEL